MQKQIENLLRMEMVARLFLSFIVSLFTFVVKRNKRIVLCTGWYGYRFADNSRYMYQYLYAHKDKLGLKKIVWITKDDQTQNELKSNGLNACKINSWKSFYYHLRAQYFFYDQFLNDFHSSLTKGGTCINLWHGIPIKKFGLLNGLKSTNWDLGNNYLLTCTEYGDQTLAPCFKVKADHLLHGMYPRIYYLLHDIPFLLKVEIDYLYKILKYKEASKKIIFYLPTFRKQGKLNFLGEKDPIVLKDFFEYLDSLGYAMLTKVHFHGLNLHQDSVGINSDNLLNLPAEVDIYPFLKEADILLTDYSSVLFDFLYLDKDIICFPYDYLEYSKNDQGLLLDYDSLPVDRVNDLSELKDSLMLLSKAKSSYRQKARKEWLLRCFGDKTMEDTVNSVFFNKKE